jgi:hypothetical protein
MEDVAPATSCEGVTLSPETGRPQEFRRGMAMKLLTGLPPRLFRCAAVAQRDDGVRGAQGTIRNGVPVSESFLVAGPGLEMGGLVTGQPYSAERVSEHTKTLTNGTHIDQKREMSRMYRDSEGRTRTERLVYLGPVARTGAKDTPPRLIHIYDPGGGVFLHAGHGETHRAPVHSSDSVGVPEDGTDSGGNACAPCGPAGRGEDG